MTADKKHKIRPQGRGLDADCMLARASNCPGKVASNKNALSGTFSLTPGVSRFPYLALFLNKNTLHRREQHSAT